MATAVRLTRVNPRTGRVERPWRNREGPFVLGDPAHGARKHHDRHAVKVPTLDEAVALVRRGFSLRMTDGESPPSLIAPDSLVLEEVEGEEDDQGALWAETLPEPPFGKGEMLAELRKVLLVQANQIAHAGRPEYAEAFIGFRAGEASAVPYGGDDPGKVDLARFDATKYLDAAYDYAFQVGRYWEFGEDTARDVAGLVSGANPSASSGEPSPLADSEGLCRRTADTALGRWRLEAGYDLTVRELALLAGMRETAVRNSLSKERIAIEGGAVDGTVARDWLEGRRDFVPTRKTEGNGRRREVAARLLLERRGLAEALDEILKGVGLSPSALAAKAEVPEPFVGAVVAGCPEPDVEALCRVAEALGLDAPHFAGIAVETALRARRA